MTDATQRVAEAICKAHQPYLGSSPDPALYKFLARAAIAALQQGDYEDRDGCWHRFTVDRWREATKSNQSQSKSAFDFGPWDEDDGDLSAFRRSSDD